MLSAYNGSVKGMSDTAKAYILRLQPYQPGNGGKDHQLRILHDLNIADKHHALVIVKNAFRQEMTLTFKPTGIGLHTITHIPHEDGTLALNFSQPVRPTDVKHKITLTITFAEFGRSRLVPVVHGLWQLWHAANRPLAELAGEFR